MKNRLKLYKCLVLSAIPARIVCPSRGVSCGVLGAVPLQWLDAAPHPSLGGGSQPSRQLCSERNAKQRGRELRREKAP